jgi:hypothetical protein
MVSPRFSDATASARTQVPAGDVLSSFTLDVANGAWPKLRSVRFLPRRGTTGWVF